MKNDMVRFGGDTSRGVPGSILLIEDEEMLRILLETLLVEKGYTVLTAGDGLEGLNLYKQNKNNIGVVLTDMKLPTIDGYTAFLEMKRINPDVKAIFASGHIDNNTRARLQLEGVRHFITKPYLVEEVLKAIVETLKE